MQNIERDNWDIVSNKNSRSMNNSMRLNLYEGFNPSSSSSY